MIKKYSIFHIQGGLGKHVAATAVAKTIKNNYPERDLIVVCAYPEIFINLEYVSRVYALGNTSYFYQDYIENKDFLLFKHEPYFTTEHVKKELPLIENWSNLYNLKYSGESPEIKFNYRQEFVNNKLWKRDKPILLIQTNGGPLTGQPFLNSWTRDIPNYILNYVVEEFQKTHHIIQVCRDNSQGILNINVEVVDKPLTNIELFGLVKVSDKRLLIDSSLQHAAKSLNKPSTVLWIGTDPKVFGYNIHDNIKANLNNQNQKLINSYLFDYDFTGVLHECPTEHPTTFFDINTIINSLHKHN
jgi:hypothetical protein